MLRSVTKIMVLTLFMSGTAVAVNSEQHTQDPRDPYESFNRPVFKFNDVIDRNVLKPAAKGYVRAVPENARKLVTNFFNNLTEPRNLINSLLQGQFAEAGKSTGRLLINSTVGMLGLLDVAKTWGLEERENDFGYTLRRWGVPGDSYLQLPFSGPNTVRSAIGIYPDAVTWPTRYYLQGADYWAAVAVWGIDRRSGFLKQEDLIVGDRYTFIKDAYLQHRDYVYSGEFEDEF